MTAPNENHPALDLFRRLVAVPAPSGREERVARIVRDRIEHLGYAHRTDPAGNVIVTLEGRNPDAPLTVLAAHMDEIGMVVTHVEPDGTLRVDRSGGLHPWKLGEGPVEIVTDGESTITGLLSFGSTHRKGVESQGVTWTGSRILTGLSPEQLAAAGVRPGSTAVPTAERRGPVLFGDARDPLVAAWTFDDRMGVVAQLRLLEALRSREIKPAGPMLIAFTVHEEGGAHGAKVLAHREQPEVFIAVDGCPMPPGSPLRLDGRPAVWSKDRVAHSDQRLVRALRDAALEAGTELQTVVYDAAASDASLAYATGAVPRVVTVGHVRENSHGYEVARLSVFDNLLKTLVRFIESWEG